MPKPAELLAIVACTAPLVTGCVPARIVEAEGKRVTFAWDARETSIARVHTLAIDWCHRWRAPPALVDDRIEGQRHATTFVCRPQQSLPVNRIL